MKKRKMLLPAALAAAVMLCFWLLTSASFCIGRIEERTDEQWSQIHMYMNGERTVEFPVREEGQLCIFQWETGRGSFRAEITDASGAVLFSTDTNESGSEAIPAGSDLTLHLDAEGHGGVFCLFLRDEPKQTVADPEAEAEPYLLYDGTHTGGVFTETYTCRRYDGKRLNFYVENNGTAPVVITINGTYDRTIPEGSSGHISAPISASVMPQDMSVKCVSADGEDIDIYWKVAQRG